MNIPVSIIDGCRKNDRASQEQLHRLCYVPLMRVALRYTGNQNDAGEILNKAFFNILTRIDQFGDQGNFFGWMKRIVVNMSLDHLRATKRLKIQEFKAEIMTETTGNDGHSMLLQNDILGMLKELPQMQALVFNLFALEGYSHSEIAEMLSITEANSKWQLYCARQILQKKLQNTVKNTAI